VQSILVTGGAGYIGSHTCKALAEAGYRPITFDNLSTGHRWAVKWGPLVEGELADQQLIREAIEEYQVGAVIHFAANALVGESMRAPYKYLNDNAAGSLSLLEAMRHTRVGRIVFSSTCATYGLPGKVPIAETQPQVPINPYGESKLFVERSLEWYRRAHGISFVTLRYFNAAGADEQGEIGESREIETHLIPLAIQAALGQGPPVQVLGTDYPTPDGTAVRDYIHVADLADAHVRALEYLRRGGASVAVNLGNGRGYSVREVIAAVERTGWRPVPVIESGRRAGDPPSLVADATRARELLGWKPRYASLDAIVLTAFRYHSSQAALCSLAVAGD